MEDINKDINISLYSVINTAYFKVAQEREGWLSLWMPVWRGKGIQEGVTLSWYSVSTPPCLTTMGTLPFSSDTNYPE